MYTRQTLPPLPLLEDTNQTVYRSIELVPWENSGRAILPRGAYYLLGMVLQWEPEDRMPPPISSEPVRVSLLHWCRELQTALDESNETPEVVLDQLYHQPDGAYVAHLRQVELSDPFWRKTLIQSTTDPIAYLRFVSQLLQPYPHPSRVLPAVQPYPSTNHDDQTSPDWELKLMAGEQQVGYWDQFSTTILRSFGNHSEKVIPVEAWSATVPLEITLSGPWERAQLRVLMLQTPLILPQLRVVYRTTRLEWREGVYHWPLFEQVQWIAVSPPEGSLVQLRLDGVLLDQADEGQYWDSIVGSLPPGTILRRFCLHPGMHQPSGTLYQPDSILTITTTPAGPVRAYLRTMHLGHWNEGSYWTTGLECHDNQ